MKKTILITGSTDGIGKSAVIKLAKDGHEVYLHGRNADKLATVISEVKAASDNKAIKGYVADFSDLDAVKQMAATINQQLPKLDILINNAGVFKSPKQKTAANFDIRYAVNYFAPYLLTNGVLPLLKKATAPRIINLSSAAQAPVSMEGLKGTQAMAEMEAYSQSKLAITMWSMYLAEKEPEVIVIPVNPGSLLNTRMVKEGFGYHRSSPDKGANILYDLAINEKYNDDSGKYFDNDSGGFGVIHPAGNSQEAIQMLIEQTNAII